ncbi:MAG: hypothetical protein GY939_12640 [Actinomycetia bacterium]|nr:hypothetical protein [Actinomycetes bacterium]
MARLIGVGVFLWSMYATMSYAWGLAPQPTEKPVEASPVTTVESSFAEAEAASAAQAAAILEELIDANEEASALPTELGFAEDSSAASSTATRWISGTYSIGDDPDPRVAARDRDIAPRQPLFEEDERLESLSVPAYMRTIQGQLEPGLYSTVGEVDECDYQLWRVMKRTRQGQVIGEEYISGGRLLVTIDGIEPDWFTAGIGCGQWQRWTPRADPTAPITNGDYGAGDLAPGTWQVPDGCLWERVVAFRGASLRDVAASGQGPAVLEIDDSGMGLRLRGCQSLTTFDPPTKQFRRLE